MQVKRHDFCESRKNAKKKRVILKEVKNLLFRLTEKILRCAHTRRSERAELWPPKAALSAEQDDTGDVGRSILDAPP